MGGLINLIKNLFSGIFSFLGGLFGGKKSIEPAGNGAKVRKSPGYFMELDESQLPKTSADSQPKKDTAPAATQEAKTEASAAPATTSSSPKKSSKRAELLAAAATSNGTAPAEAAPAVSAPVAVATPQPEATAGFATKYLVPSSNGSRRRPGANMNSYLDMAKEMKSN
jgi:hypothetical protein